MRGRQIAVWMLALLLAVTTTAAGEPVSALIAAAREGDEVAVRGLVDGHANVDARDAQGATALHWAVERNHPAIVEILLDGGATVDAANRHGITPLFLAAVNASPALVTRLLDAGANPAAARSDGETVLMTAARTGSVDVLRILAERGADVNATEKWRGQTALMWAAAQKHAAAARLLIDRGAHVNARSTAGYSPLVFAVRAGDRETVRVLLGAGADVNQTVPDGTSALVVAITNAHYSLGTFLLDAGADPNRGAPGGTPLHSAVRSRSPDTVAMPNPPPAGDSLAFIASLLDHGAEVNARLAKGPNSTFLNLTGATPFMLAAHAVDAPLMRLLLDRGADPRLTTQQKSTALMAAAGLGFDEGRHTGWSERASLEAVTIALGTGGDINAVDDNGNTALHGAALTGANSVVSLLVEKGARLDVTNGRGYQPVTIAEGIYLGALHKYRPETGKLLRQLMDTTAKRP